MDTSKKEWALRSVQKYPEAAIPPDLRTNAVKDILAEGISASYPYGALSMEPLSKAAGIPYLSERWCISLMIQGCNALGGISKTWWH
jgi:hypothetical protein